MYRNASWLDRSVTRAAWLGFALSACSSPHAAPDATGGTLEALPARDAGASPSGDAGTDAALAELEGLPSASCGNGLIEPPESCEPPATDACDSNCQSIPPVPALADSGAPAEGHGCDAACQIELCGNGELEPGEDCEPPGVGRCDASCHAVRVECGDGTTQEGEECDDGNVAFGDGCSPSCQIEKCDNGRLEAPAETCEPPGTSACGPLCRAPVCGDGRLDAAAGEQCEDGNLRAGDGCSPQCRIEVCGNGVVDRGEQCEPPGTEVCGRDCLLVDGNAASAVAGPIDARAFVIQNPSFAGSLEPWEIEAPSPSSVQLGSLDAGAVPRSGSAQVNLSADSPSATLWQCVRTAAGAAYRLSLATRGVGTADTTVPVEMGVSFYAEEDCSGEVFDGVRTYNAPDQNGRWLVWRLPPASPIANVESSFEAPEGARSMQVWVYLEEDTADGPNSVLVDDVQLLRASPVSCGDGIPESPEECEPSVSAGCLDSCQLARVCGDGIEAPGECASCAADCRAGSPRCGDGVVSVPEECELPGVGACRADCTWGSSVCGNGRVEGAETCDPPNGESCGSDCTAIECGNRKVEPPEQCDPPGTGQCSRHCRLLAEQPSSCGNGLLEGAEQCDPPNPATWCSKSCQRRNPQLACGDGAIDRDLGEECDPPGAADNCGPDCHTAVCGDSRVGGAEQCDPPNATTCSAECRLQGDALECTTCLADRCRGASPEQDTFAACFERDGFALAGPAQNTPLRQLCGEAVECMRATGCAAELRSAEAPNPAACYCGKSVLTANPVAALRACRDGVVAADGPCRAVFERAAESQLPSSVLAALLDAQNFSSALGAAIDLMQSCGSATSGCQLECSVAGSCGNGVVEPGELCEPASNPYCAPGVCAVLPCGNGVVDVVWPYGQPENPDPVLRGYQQPPDWVPESCDVRDPFTNQGGKCDEGCHLLVTCGDGEVNPSAEACDPGAPSGDWSECCQPNSPGYNATAQLSSCDRNGNGRIDRTEQCQVPAVCGNGKREGLEECDLDPPDTSKCLNCKAVDACAECTRASCADAQRSCFEAPTAATRVGCAEVLECYDGKGCGQNRDYSQCLCGDRAPLQQECGTLGPNGPCAEVMQKNLPCGYPNGLDLACVQQSGTNPAFGTGAAYQVVNCRKYFCATECNYAPFQSDDE
jgi:cysteine-rich repeat protein